MNKSLLIIIGIFCVFSCNRAERPSTRDQQGRRIFYSEEEYYNSKIKEAEVVIIDTACINLKVKALNDIKANKLIYYHSLCPHQKEFQSALEKYDIATELGNLPSDVVIGRFASNCYEEEMMEEIIRRYGHDFFDTIWNQTLKAHMKKFPNDFIEESGKKIMWKDVYKQLLK